MLVILLAIGRRGEEALHGVPDFFSVLNVRVYDDSPSRQNPILPLYQVVKLASSGAFRVSAGEAPNGAILVYLSFVTLATLGYGDISPVKFVARDLAVLEAIMGQLYLVILISRLVSEGVEKSEKG